jgi:hypothetical protein
MISTEHPEPTIPPLLSVWGGPNGHREHVVEFRCLCVSCAVRRCRNAEIASQFGPIGSSTSSGWESTDESTTSRVGVRTFSASKLFALGPLMLSLRQMPVE